MTDNEFITTYRIVSIRGRLYSRDMLLNAATRTPVRRRLAELGLTLKISPDGGQHWQVRDRDGRIAEWWPQTGRFVALGNYRRPQKFHDVLGFVGAVHRVRRAP